MSLKNYIFSSINTKGGQDSDKFATIRFKSLRSMEAKNGDGVGRSMPAVKNDGTPIKPTTATALGELYIYASVYNLLNSYTVSRIENIEIDFS